MYNNKHSGRGQRSKEKMKSWGERSAAMRALIIILIIVGASVVSVLILWATGVITFGNITPEQEEEFSVQVLDRFDNEELTTANISYWDADNDGLPDDMLASGNADNVTMLNYNFPSATAKYWLKAELSGYKTWWMEIDIDGENIARLTKLPTANGTLSVLDTDNGGDWDNSTASNVSILVDFANSLNGTGFYTTYNADTNTTSYLTIEIATNETGISVNDFVIEGVEVEDKKVESGGVVTIPLTSDLLIPESGAPDLNLSGEFDLGNAEVSSVKLVYDNVVYAYIDLSGA
jgi:hypothetical protein